jgi:hypothetical protein
VDIRTCKKPELDALNDRAKVWREQHSPNPDGIKDQSARPPQDQQAPAKDLSTLSPTGQLLLFSVEPTIRSKPPSARRRSSPPDKCSSENLALDEIHLPLGTYSNGMPVILSCSLSPL